MSDDLVAAVKRAYPEWRGTMCEECGLPFPICNDRALVRERDVRAERSAQALTEARAEIERLRGELADTKDDFLRRHKDAVDRFERIGQLESELSTLRARVREVVGLGLDVISEERGWGTYPRMEGSEIYTDADVFSRAARQLMEEVK